ncbi:MAG TPA: iron-sulfur cluster repair di-iron protein [Cyclobacteriaceae bacterium]|nr:iron-sulfur cluster repair di-iron protein [Cyclobacteriaceae bacterium]
MEELLEKTIGEIVAEDYRTSRVFEKHNIDFCCKGNRSINEACELKDVDRNVLIDELAAVRQGKPSKATDFNNWPLDELADHIERVHHKYVEENLPILNQYLNKLCNVHGARHPELFEIYDEFKLSSGELATHMKKEEFILFPHIRKMVNARLVNVSLKRPHFGTVQNPVQMMMHEHSVEGGRFEKIGHLTSNYAAPSDACNTYRVTYALLEEFEQDLHLHIHLENNILFPKAIEMEREFEMIDQTP